MMPTLFNLVCLGLFLVLEIWAQMGDFDKPTLSAWPSHMVPAGQRATLLCQSNLGFDMFRLYKEDGKYVTSFRLSFVTDPVETKHVGIYRCSGMYRQSPYEASEPSDALMIVVTGVYRKPSLLALPQPLVKSGGMVILQCHSEVIFDTFILMLHREGVTEDPLHLVRELYDGCCQANVSIAPVASIHVGTYQCYGSLTYKPYEWSEPSDPLDIKITGSALQDYTLGNSIRMGVAGLVLLALLTMLAEAWWSCEEPRVGMEET